jgi:hypothetical protein
MFKKETVRKSYDDPWQMLPGSHDGWEAGAWCLNMREFNISPHSRFLNHSKDKEIFLMEFLSLLIQFHQILKVLFKGP